MFNQQSEIARLLEKADWTDQEKQWLLQMLEKTDESELKDHMQRLFFEDLENPQAIDASISERVIHHIHGQIAFRPEKAKLLRMRMVKMAAACVIGLLVLSTYLLLNDPTHQYFVQKRINHKTYKNEGQPGGSKALLTLADGSTIVLDNTRNGTLAQQGNTQVVKTNGTVDYNPSGAAMDHEMLFNTITTPRGGQYRVELPDGTKVWLNAASSLHFPTSFSGKERRVELTGEAYLEVAKNKTKPFIVTVNRVEIEVLGTHFNVMAYNNEATIETTLLEGLIYVKKDDNSKILRPGQQSQFTSDGKMKVVDDVDLSRVVAWKNGYFDFDGLDFETVASQLSRWYDVEVIYERKIDERFYAKIPRDTKLPDVLKALELTGKIQFEFAGNKIVVKP